MLGGIYLTPEQLKRLTGYRSRPAVIRWLERNKWPFAAPGSDGWPKVLREYHDNKLLGIQVSIKKTSDAEPVWSV